MYTGSKATVLLLIFMNCLDFLLFGMQCVLKPAQALSPKLISHVSGSLTLYSNKLSSFELHLLIYSARELHNVCAFGQVLVVWENDHCLLSGCYFTKEKIFHLNFTYNTRISAFYT